MSTSANNKRPAEGEAGNKPFMKKAAMAVEADEEVEATLLWRMPGTDIALSGSLHEVATRFVAIVNADLERAVFKCDVIPPLISREAGVEGDYRLCLEKLESEIHTRTVADALKLLFGWLYPNKKGDFRVTHKHNVSKFTW